MRRAIYDNVCLWRVKTVFTSKYNLTYDVSFFNKEWGITVLEQYLKFKKTHISSKFFPLPAIHFEMTFCSSKILALSLKKSNPVKQVCPVSQGSERHSHTLIRGPLLVSPLAELAATGAPTATRTTASASLLSSQFSMAPLPPLPVPRWAVGSWPDSHKRCCDRPRSGRLRRPMP